MAMKAGHPSRGEALEPCYGESKSKTTLPNINPCDGSIGSCIVGLYLCLSMSMRRGKRGKYVCGALDLHRNMNRCQGVLKAGLYMHVFRFPYLAMGQFLM